jgi:hypothetical protein
MIGMLVFLLGVALLVLVFYVAFDLFTASPTKALGLQITGDPRHDPSFAKIAVQLAWVLFRIATLAVMSIAGSLIANKGINLYFSASQGHRAPAAPKDEPSETAI